MAGLKRKQVFPPKSIRPSLAAVPLAAAIAIPVVVAILLPWIPPLGTPPPLLSGNGSSLPAARLQFDQITIGSAPRDQPLITHVQIVDLDGDGHNDLLACDAARNAL